MSPAAAAGSRRLAAATAASALALLVAGALVNAQQAALSVPDWPTSYGRLLLRSWPGNTAYEQIHRIFAVVTTLLATASWVSLRRDPAARKAARLAGWTLGVLALQVLLGGVVVLTAAPAAVSAVHVLLAVLVVSLAVLAALAGAGIGAAGRGAAPWPRRALAWGLALVALQLVLGAVSRHPPFGQGPFIVTLLLHVANGLTLAVLLPVAGVRLWRRRHAAATRRLGALLAGFTLTQAGVGVWVFLISPEPLAETWPPPPGFPLAHALHVALAALVFATLVALRWLAPPAEQP